MGVSRWLQFKYWNAQGICIMLVALGSGTFGQIPVAPIAMTSTASAATTSAAVLIKHPGEFDKLSEYYAYGAEIWQAEKRRAAASKDSQGELAAIYKWQAWAEAADMARLAEQKASVAGGPVKLLPTPGAAVVAEKGPDKVAIRVTGNQIPGLDVTTNSYKPEHLQLYEDYIYGMRYWYQRTSEAKDINDTPGMQEALQKATAFELAYLAVKNAEIQAETAGTIAQVTPVPNLPVYPGSEHSAPLERVARPVQASATPTPVATPLTTMANAPSTTQTLAQATPAPRKPLVQLTNTSFRRMTGEGLWLVEFGAEWCGVCKFMKPRLMELSAEMEGKANIAYVDVTRQKALGQQFGITVLPTFLVVKNGMLKGSAKGMKKKEELAKLMGLQAPQ